MTEKRRIVVSDTGPLISLERRTGGYDFIRQLYDQIVIPVSVLEKVAWHYEDGEAYLSDHGIADLIDVREPTATDPDRRTPLSRILLNGSPREVTNYGPEEKDV